MARLFVLPLLAGAALTLQSASACAQSVADFYRGKTVSFIVGFGPGGGYDLYPRALGRHIGRHIPGNPCRTWTAQAACAPRTTSMQWRPRTAP
jgi:tripartite-type tricarboxylate transporter receptor subunit TctC